jgi:flagellar basal-body rod protein FlgG
MFRALYTAASGMSAQQLNLDNVANNLSNSSTVNILNQTGISALAQANQMQQGVLSLLR